METPTSTPTPTIIPMGFITPDRPTRAVMPLLQKRTRPARTEEPRVRRRLDFGDSDDDTDLMGQ